MLKALIRKDWQSLGTMFFQNSKAGKKRSRGSIIGLAVLYVFTYLLMAGLTLLMCFLMGPDMFAAGKAWIYFIVMGYISLFYGIIGSIYTTYALLYRAKDNEMLLSLPIAPWKILFTRVLVVYILSLIYGSIGWLPGMLFYWFSGFATVSGVICSFLMMFVIGALITAVACILGWIVAEAASRVRNKKIFTIIFLTLLIGFFIWFRIKANDIFQELLENAELVGNFTKSHLYPFYLMGAGAAGEIVPFLLFTAGVAVLFGLVYFVLSKTFFSVTMRGEKVKRVAYTSDAVRARSVRKTLISKEFQHFFASVAYVMNMGLGAIILIAGGIAVLIFGRQVREVFDLLGTQLGMQQLLPVLLPAMAALIVMFMVSMGMFTSASVSTEGQRLWIAQTLPVPAREVFFSKIAVHMLLDGIPAVIFMICAGIALKMNVLLLLECMAMMFVFMFFFALLGLVEDLRHVNLNWTNENVPIKQGLPVTVCLFGSWILAAAIVAGGYFLGLKIGLPLYIGLVILVLCALCVPLLKYLNGAGREAYQYAQ